MTEARKAMAILLARDLWTKRGDSDELEIDDDAKVSETSDGGAWVAAWVYIRLPEHQETAE